MRSFVTENDHHSLAERMASDVADILQHAIEKYTKASIVVSGGATPILFFQALRKKEIAWQYVTVFLADERWVMPSSPDSNERLVREHLYMEGMTLVSFAPIREGEALEEGAARINKELADRYNGADVVVLGMGEDGHTASLFPHHSQLQQGLYSHDEGSYILPISNAPKPPVERITLTASRLLECRSIMLHITGEGKHRVYEQALDESDGLSLPISHFLKQMHIPLTTYWSA